MRDWYIRNRDKQLEIKLQYYIDNRDRHQEWATKWRLENREKWIWQAKDWKHKNPDRANESNRRRKKINRHKVNAQTAKRRFRKAMATPKWANHDKILAFYENARVATEQTGIIHHVDHIVPLKGRNACGLHCEDNLQVITAQENLIKHNKVIE